MEKEREQNEQVHGFTDSGRLGWERNTLRWNSPGQVTQLSQRRKDNAQRDTKVKRVLFVFFKCEKCHEITELQLLRKQNDSKYHHSSLNILLKMCWKI